MSANNQQQLMNTTALNRSDSMNRSHGSPKAAAHSPYAQQVLHAADMLEKPSSNQPQTGGNGYYGCSSNSSNGSDSGEHESNGYGASSTTPTYPNYNNNGGYHHQQQYSSNSPPYQQQGSYPGSPYQRASNNGSGSNTPSRHNSYHQMQMLPASMSSQPQQQNNSNNSNGGASYANAVPPPPPSYVQATVTAAREWNNTPPQQSDSHEGTPLNRRQHSNSFNQQSSSLNNSQNNRTGRNTNSQHQRHNSSPHPPAVEGCPEGAHHTPLFGKCEWIQPPPVPEADLQTPAFPCYRLFLGQIRFETTPAEVRWIIEYVTGVQALKVETRGIGCFLAYFGAYDDMVAVQGLHKRILFDHTGIWFARTDEQAHQMQDYVRAALGRIGRGFRLPKDMMVVEEEKLQRALPIPSAPPQYNSVSTPMYSSFQQQQQQNNNGAPHHQQQQTGFSKLPEYGTAAQ